MNTIDLNRGPLHHIVRVDYDHFANCVELPPAYAKHPSATSNHAAAHDLLNWVKVCTETIWGEKNQVNKATVRIIQNFCLMLKIRGHDKLSMRIAQALRLA